MDLLYSLVFVYGVSPRFGVSNFERLRHSLRWTLGVSVLVIGAVSSSGCRCSVQNHIRAKRTGDLTLGRAPNHRPTWHQSCGEEALSEAGTTGFVRRPYVQGVTPNAASILWTSKFSVDFVVRLRRPGAEKYREIMPRKVQSQFGPIPQYSVSANDLEPGQEYCFEVFANGVQWLGKTRFRTAPPIGARRPVRIVVLGDLGYPDSDQRAVRKYWSRVEHDLILIPGDVAYQSGTRREFDRNFFRPYEHILRHVPVFPAAGNHDNKTADGGPFREVFQLPENGGEAGRERWYSFDWGAIHIVVLDTDRIHPRQVEWLQADLAKTDLSWKIVVLHRPPFSSGMHGSSLHVRNAFVPIFERNKVQLVFSGHDHNYERTRPQAGVTYVVTGGGGRGTRAVGSSQFTAFSARVAHFVYLVIEDGVAKLYALDATGQTFDTVRIVR